MTLPDEAWDELDRAVSDCVYISEGRPAYTFIPRRHLEQRSLTCEGKSSFITDFSEVLVGGKLAEGKYAAFPGNVSASNESKATTESGSLDSTRRMKRVNRLSSTKRICRK